METAHNRLVIDRNMESLTLKFKNRVLPGYGDGDHMFQWTSKPPEVFLDQVCRMPFPPW